jgi:transcriptional regulator with XRE-family HTH domain
MSVKDWEEKVRAAPGAPARVAAIEEELRVAMGLTALREQAGLSQRALARLMGVSQPRVAAIERSPNVTLDVIAQYAEALGGHLEVTIVRGKNRVLVGPAPLRPAKRSVTEKGSRGPAPLPAEVVRSNAGRPRATGNVGAPVRGRVAATKSRAKVSPQARRGPARPTSKAARSS